MRTIELDGIKLECLSYDDMMFAFDGFYIDIDESLDAAIREIGMFFLVGSDDPDTEYYYVGFTGYQVLRFQNSSEGISVTVADRNPGEDVTALNYRRR